MANPIKNTKRNKTLKAETKKGVKASYRKSTQDIKPEIQDVPKQGIRKSRIIFLLAVIAIIGLAYNFKQLFIVATVNGQPISRISIVKQLEKQNGKQVLNNIITKNLILQEAEKQNIVISGKEVNDEIKKFENILKQRNQNLSQFLQAQGITKEELYEQIEVQKAVEKMVGKDVKVTDKEVDEYLEKNKELLPEDIKEDELKKNVKEELKLQKLNEKFEIWLEDLKKKAKINYFVNY